MTFNIRLKEFIHNNYDSIKSFSDQIKIDQTQLSKYIKGIHTPSYDILVKLFDAGLNINWLISGTGSMFADNDVGNKLRMEYEASNLQYRNRLIEGRLLKWINDKYKSLEKFTKKFNLDFDRINSEMNNNSSPSPQFIVSLHKAGCDFDWVLSGQVHHSSVDPDGNIYSAINNDNANKQVEPENSHSKIINQEIYSYIRKAIKDEFNTIKRESE